MTMSGVWQFVRCLTVSILAPILAFASGPSGQSHVVSPTDLRREAVAASSARQHNLETINGFLSSPKAERVLATTGVDVSGLKAAVSALDDRELARLAARAELVQADFAAGRISDRDLLIILVGFVALILIIVAVR